MNLGVWATIVAILVKLWSVFRGGSGTRITVEARPEAAIAEEKKELSRLSARIKALEKELENVCTKMLAAFVAIRQEKKGDNRREVIQGFTATVDTLDAKRELLISQLRDARQEYERTQGCSGC